MHRRASLAALLAVAARIQPGHSLATSTRAISPAGRAGGAVGAVRFGGAKFGSSRRRHLCTMAAAAQDALTRPPSTLLVTCTADPASVVMREALLGRGKWEQMAASAAVEECGLPLVQAWRHEREGVWMVCLEGGMVRADNVDVAFERAHGVRDLTDVIFLSRHAAASGQPSLTCHPIGIPNPTADASSGGVPGKCPPPNPRLAACLRELASVTAGTPLSGDFEVTFETTHHGPILSTPAMFCEIGSTEEHWDRRDAAEVWADVLANLLHLNAPSTVALVPAAAAAAGAWCALTPSQRASAAAFISLGGGHYAPKAGDLARKPGVFVGHMLANYAFDWSADSGDGGSGDGGVPGGWRSAVVEAVSATRAALPGASLHALVDKKNFKSAQRAAVEALLGELGVAVAYKRDAILAASERAAAAAAAAAAAGEEGGEGVEAEAAEAAVAVRA